MVTVMTATHPYTDRSTHIHDSHFRKTISLKPYLTAINYFNSKNYVHGTHFLTVLHSICAAVRGGFGGEK
jgi:hypothetical protein